MRFDWGYWKEDRNRARCLHEYILRMDLENDPCIHCGEALTIPQVFMRKWDERFPGTDAMEILMESMANYEPT